MLCNSLFKFFIVLPVVIFPSSRPAILPSTQLYLPHINPRSPLILIPFPLPPLPLKYQYPVPQTLAFPLSFSYLPSLLPFPSPSLGVSPCTRAIIHGLQLPACSPSPPLLEFFLSFPPFPHPFSRFPVNSSVSFPPPQWLPLPIPCLPSPHPFLLPSCPLPLSLYALLSL